MRFEYPRRLARQLRLDDARPAIAWTASLLFLLGGVGALISVAKPFSPHAPVHLDAACGVLACLIALWIWIWGARLPLLAFQVVIAVAVLMESAVIAAATTRGGMLMTAFMYTWIAVYAAHFFPPKVVAAAVALIVASFTAGLAIDGIPNVLLAWLIVTCTVCALGFVLSRLNQSLRQQAGTDELTGLLNRSGFLAAAVRERAIADRSRAPLSVAVLDLNGFKQVNDSLGHAAGDRLLADLAVAWRARLRAGDVLARHGGDEFVLLLPGTDSGDAAQALQRLHAPEVPITWSAGVSQWIAGEDLDTCLAKADRELYAAKDSRHIRAAVGTAGATLARLA
ncbi:MAG TPA: GGDEF domain-containing protein [Solirubrobacteraceae bacterium]|jgi:diguanylate cyclase (GGDEF)-like protein|nr:GGDEF domain-containing protein [Solirubrobacteraceae bacterium]